MVPSPAVRMAAVLLVLGVAVATVPAHPMPSVMEIRAGWKTRAHASVASTASAAPKEQSYEDGYYEEKEICLQEVSRRDCSTQSFQMCPTAGGNCGNPHAQWTSDVSCCQHNDYGNYGYGHGSASVGDHLWGPHASIGSCDWTTDYVRRVEVTSNINKWGSASAICYFGADAQECGGPFCDRMVVTLEGAVYYVEKVYTYYSASNTNTDECAADGFPGILPIFGGITSGARVTDGAAPDQRAAPKPGTKSVGGAAHTADASIQYNHYEGEHHTTNTVYTGNAWVVNGAVTAMVSPKKDHWENGLFEYVIQFTLDTTAGANPVTSVDASIPWVRDKTYKFTFFKSGGYY